MYDDLGLCQRFLFCFCCCCCVCVCVCVWTPWGPWGNRWFNDLQYLASTKGNSSALVGDRSCTCVCFIVLLESLFLFLLLFVCLFLHFMVYSVETVTETFWALFFFSFFLFPLFSPPCLSFVVLRKTVTLIFFIFFLIIYFTLLLLLINANHDRFAVFCDRYCSACDWRFIWCQFVANVEENPGGFPITVKCRRPYAITVVTNSILCIVAAIWRGCRKFESCT